MKKVLKFVEELENDPKNDNGKHLTKSQICKKIGISDSSLKRTMKNLNIKSFYRHDIPVNKKKTKKNNNKDVEDQNEAIKKYNSQIKKQIILRKRKKK